MASVCRRGRARPARPVFLLPALLLLWSCSNDLGVSLVKPPPAAPALLVVGDIEAEDPEARRLARFMRAALLEQLLRAQAFAVVYDRDSLGAGETALVLEGVITQADAGSEALRFVIGSGFGRPHLAATFRLLDGEGSARVAFSSASNDPGPTGLSAHWRPLSMEDLAKELGRDAADVIVRWSEGKELASAPLF